MSSYAENTKVSPERSIAEIKRTLEKYGCTAFFWGETKDKISIGFELAGIQFKLKVPLADHNDPKLTRTPTGRMRRGKSKEEAWNQDKAERFRKLLLLLKAKLEAVHLGIETLEKAFLSNLVLPTGETVGEHIMPKVQEALEERVLPPLIEM